MISRSPQFYFANLGADILRCIKAADDDARYRAALERVDRTLAMLRACKRPEAYEEALLLTRALEYARSSQQREVFERNANRLIEDFVKL